MSLLTYKEPTDESTKQYVEKLMITENGDPLSEFQAQEIMDFLTVFSFGCSKYLEMPVTIFSKALEIFVPELIKQGFKRDMINQLITKASFKIRLED